MNEFVHFRNDVELLHPHCYIVVYFRADYNPRPSRTSTDVCYLIEKSTASNTEDGHNGLQMVLTGPANQAA